MPEAWEFDIRFDEKTGHLKQVVAGDNAPYASYIEAHNQAIDTSREAVEQLIPAAEKTGVIIALENVWNNLWVKPDVFRNFVASFDNPWVRAYFDIGNHVKYAPPAGVDPHAGQADRQVPREGLQAQRRRPRRQVRATSATAASTGRPCARRWTTSATTAGLTIEGGELCRSRSTAAGWT